MNLQVATATIKVHAVGGTLASLKKFMDKLRLQHNRY